VTHLTVSIPAGLGEARDALVARSADAVIAIGGSSEAVAPSLELARHQGAAPTASALL
jgi:hypothetical protein